jgi:hypothetical protein
MAKCFKTVEAYKIMSSFTIITSTRFLDIISIINSTIEWKTNFIKQEIEKTQKLF